jgi:hypothetical protein
MKADVHPAIPTEIHHPVIGLSDHVAYALREVQGGRAIHLIKEVQLHDHLGVELRRQLLDPAGQVLNLRAPVLVDHARAVGADLS